MSLIKAGENIQVSLTNNVWVGAQATSDENLDGTLSLMAQDIESATCWRFMSNLSKYITGDTSGKWRLIPLLIFLLCFISKTYAEDKCRQEKSDAAFRCSAYQADLKALNTCQEKLKKCQVENKKCGDCSWQETAVEGSKTLCEDAEKKLKICQAN